METLTVTPAIKEIAQLEPFQGKKGNSLSFSIGRQYQRQGLMQEAVTAVIHQLFYGEGVDYINCGCYTFNHASRALQKKLGFQHFTTLTFEEEGSEEPVVSEENILWRPNH